ncbi:MAG: LysR family transcriptional regulator, partial [Pseudomonadota bacterium]
MIDRRIKIRHLQCFAEVVRCGSLKAAADRLGLTQPAMSRTLSELEDILGTRIVQRHRSGATLTPAGDVFWSYIRTSLAALQQGVDGLGQIGAQGGGILTIGALPSVAASLVPRVAQRLQEQRLAIGLRIQEGAHADLIDRLHDGALDVVIGRLGSLDRMQGLTFSQLYTETVVFVV